MNLRLSGIVGEVQQSWLLERSPTRVGRSSTNGLQILDPTVSKEHAEFTLDKGRWSVRDLGTRNGTRVNGRSAEQPTPLLVGDMLEVGRVMLRVGSDASSSIELGTPEGVDSSLRMKVEDVLRQPDSGVDDSSRLVQLLAEAGQLLVLPRPMSEVCEEILRLVDRAVPSNRSVLLLREREGAELVPIATRGSRGSDPNARLALSQSILSAVLEDNTAIITRDALNDPRFMGQHSIVAQAIHSAMAVPLFDNERVIGLIYIDSTDARITYAAQQLTLLTLIANMAAVKITNARLLATEEVRRRMAHELATATRIQQTLLPSAPTDVSGWTFHARLETCHEVGGDLFDFHRRDDGRHVVLIGDVSGKGMGAAMLMSSILSAARVLYDVCPTPLALVQRLNDAMYKHTEGQHFVTVFVGFLDAESGHLDYVNAGHPDAHLVSPGTLRTLEATGIPVGMLADFPWQMATTVVSRGEMVALFSDGIPEAQRDREFYEFERLATSLASAQNEADLGASAQRVLDDVAAFTTGWPRADDITLVLFRRS